jgi:hypothetical protein
VYGAGPKETRETEIIQKKYEMHVAIKNKGLGQVQQVDKGSVDNILVDAVFCLTHCI